MDRREDVEVVEAKVRVRAAVHGEAAAEPVGLLVDGPVVLRAQVALQAGRGQHPAAHAQFLDRAPQLRSREFRLLHRQQRQRLQAVVLLQVLLVYPVVVGAGRHRYLVEVDHPAHR